MRTPTPFICKYCRATAFTTNAKAQFCSTKCRGASQKRKDKTCPICTTKFRAHNAEQVYCSQKCHGEASKIPNNLQCTMCLRRFEGSKKQRHSATKNKNVYCCKQCRIKGQAQSNTKKYRTEEEMRALISARGYCYTLVGKTVRSIVEVKQQLLLIKYELKKRKKQNEKHS